MPHYSIAEFHGAVTHFPVAMLIAAVAFEVGAPLFRKPEWRVVSFWLLVTGVVGSIPSLVSGWITGNQFYGSDPNPPFIFVRHRLAAFITSGLALLLLIWRASVNKSSGAPLILSILLTAVVGAMVGGTGYLGGLMTMGGGDSSTPAPSTEPQPSTLPAIDPALVAQGKVVYAKNGCANCHILDGAGSAAGPNLSHEGNRNANVDWQITHLENSAKVHPGPFMPSYAKLSDADLKALGTYLASLK